MISRRLFLKSGALAFVSAGVLSGAGPQWLRSSALAAGGANGPNTQRKKTLIVLFQRGAVDGLSVVVPHGDPSYYKHRSTNGIAIARTGPNAVVDLDGRFGLHPALAGLLPIYKGGHLAIVHAVGSPDATRSHFDAQDFMEAGTPGRKAETGWLARALAACPEDARKSRTTFGAVSLTSALPRSLFGSGEALAIADLRSFGVKDAGLAAAVGQMGGASGAAGAAAGFENLYEQAVGDVLHGTGKDSFEAIKIVRELKPDSYRPARGAKYPRGVFGDSLQQIAQLVKANVGLEVAFAESGGWDTHVNQGGAQGNLARKLGEWGEGLKALYLDLGDRMADVVIVTMSEFGRTARQNGGGGTDHGHGTCFFVLGDKVNGGKVLGDWPGLAPEQLYEDRDLAITTDFRAVLGEVARKHLRVPNLASVFPGYTGTEKDWRGVLKA
jgi:uncharacterized protein (DUF1501 family)